MVNGLQQQPHLPAQRQDPFEPVSFLDAADQHPQGTEQRSNDVRLREGGLAELIESVRHVLVVVERPRAQQHATVGTGHDLGWQVTDEELAKKAPQTQDHLDSSGWVVDSRAEARNPMSTSWRSAKSMSSCMVRLWATPTEEASRDATRARSRGTGHSVASGSPSWM